jgi:hypothetical protein
MVVKPFCELEYEGLQNGGNYDATGNELEQAGPIAGV